MEITGQWLLGIKLRSSRLKLSHVSPPPHSQHLLVRQTLQLTQSMTCWLDMLTSNPPAPPFSASLVPGCQTDGIRPWFHLSSEAQPSRGGGPHIHKASVLTTAPSPQPRGSPPELQAVLLETKSVKPAGLPPPPMNGLRMAKRHEAHRATSKAA